MQLIATMAKGNTRIMARLSHPLGEKEAREAYEYLVRTHAKYGWDTPPQHEG